jgi:sarcosine oxidase subunit beta
VSRRADAVVIGGGIQGCATALQLARRGPDVVLLEQHHVGRHASGVNAGGVRMLRRDKAEILLSVASMRMGKEIEEMLGGRYTGFLVSGQVAIAEDENDWAWVVARAARIAALHARRSVSPISVVRIR